MMLGRPGIVLERDEAGGGQDTAGVGQKYVL